MSELTGPADLTDDELLAELRASDDPQEIVLLRALAAQRGLHSGARNMDPGERRRRVEEGPAV